MVRITNIQMSERLDNGTKSDGGERPTSNSDNSVPRTSTRNDGGETDSTGISDSRGRSGGAMVLGKLPVPGRPTILITVGQGGVVGWCDGAG